MATDGDELPIDNLIDSMEQKVTGFEKGESHDCSTNVKKSSSMFSSIKKTLTLTGRRSVT